MSGPEFVNSFAEWQADDLIQNCLHCQTKFTFLVRKHHCRCCGGIFCANCSDKFLWYNRRRVKVVRRQDDPESAEFPPHRTCTSCCENLIQMQLVVTKWGDRNWSSQAAMDRSNARPSANSVLIEPNIDRTLSAPTSSSASPFQNNEVNKKVTAGEASHDVDLDVDRCPICNCDLAKLTEAQSVSHIQNCVRVAEMTKQHHQHHSHQNPGNSTSMKNPVIQNRMLVYVVPNKPEVPSTAEGEYPECPICFEEMKAGDKVGRLECLCVFHYDCIKSWFRKKSQKVKATSANGSSKNFCPLHDAVI
ncbi:LAME_0G06436g1_1 [Lachancea meyersii CBS 8951]|uniref:RING-type E3 ubiquitin transferase n=1 Tax=Lachancea meyersii CBS 8951 TaxID=1266667 RepID=A0A1G4K7K5_9SACH|nr:LAME_0G06436g1_1 [Lachancea meyersii CBS 8951]